jgi:hypothetical protein
MPIRMASSPSEDPSTHNTNGLYTDEVRPTGSAGTASLDALASVGRTGGGSGGTVAAPGSNIAESADRGNLESTRRVTKDEADRLYEENIEDEYAKREGGA